MLVNSWLLADGVDLKNLWKSITKNSRLQRSWLGSPRVTRTTEMYVCTVQTHQRPESVSWLYQFQFDFMTIVGQKLYTLTNEVMVTIPCTLWYPLWRWRCKDQATSKVTTTVIALRQNIVLWLNGWCMMYDVVEMVKLWNSLASSFFSLILCGLWHLMFHVWANFNTLEITPVLVYA